jgi:hypothetical protein
MRPKEVIYWHSFVTRRRRRRKGRKLKDAANVNLSL